MKNNFLELFNKCPNELKSLAFTHSSFANQNGVESNERIEFLGDSVLSTIVSSYLYKHCNKPEGKLSKIRASFVCTESLANLAKELGIEKNIKLGKSFHDKVSDAILADTIESMIGAIYLTYGLHSISGAVLNALSVPEQLKKGIHSTDYKSILQEYSQSKKLKLEYKCDTYLTESGQTNFRANVLLDNKFMAYGQGSTKREAEQNAAKKTLDKLKKSEDKLKNL